MASVRDRISVEPAVTAHGLLVQLIEGLESNEMEREEAIRFINNAVTALHDQMQIVKSAGG